jgi:hypothetical protein
MFLAVFVLPVMTLGLWQLYARRKETRPVAVSP